MVRKNYVTSVVATSPQSCARGLSALQFLQWMFTSLEVDAVAASSNVARLSSLTADIQAAYISALNGVLCDGSTLLITLPTVWQVSSGMSSGAGAICLLAAALCLAAIAYTGVYRQHPVIRSSSPIFLSTSLAGVALLLCGTFAMLQPATTATCSSLAWLWSLGFSLTFAPLFAKTWRIYRIFGRRKLSVVKIPNHRLAMMVIAILAVDAVLMAVWQALSPLQPYTTTQYTGSMPVVQHDYEQCGVEGDGNTLLALVAVSKGVLLVFGALMAFSTRRVSSTFNESSGIALAIYNVLFSIGIIAPIILVISAIGDVRVLLLLFLGLWVSCFTAAILMGPKMLHIHGAAGQAENNASQMSKASSSGQYSFLSLAQLSTVPVVMAYVAALHKHLAVAEKRLTELKQGRHGSVAGAAAGAGPGGARNVSKQSASPPSEPSSVSRHLRRDTFSGQGGGASSVISPATHTRFVLASSDSNTAPEESDVLNTPSAQSSPAAGCKPRSAVFQPSQAQQSPLLREKRPLGRSSRADGSNGAGEESEQAGGAGLSTSGSGVPGGSPLLGHMRGMLLRGSSESEQQRSESEN